MRVLHVIDNMEMGGAQSLLVELLPILRECGDEVEVLELAKAKDTTLTNRLKSKGIKVWSISSNGTERNPIHILKLIPILRKFDIVHVHLFPANYWVSLAKLFSFSKIPIVTTEHSTTNKRRGNKFLKLIDSFVYRNYDEVIACGDKAQITFKDAFPNSTCISIPNGVNIKRFIEAEPYSKQKLLGISESCFVMVMVARFIPSKRQDTLIKSLKFLDSRFHVALVGGKPDDEGLIKIKNLAQEMEVLDRVHFLYVRDDIPRILKTCDAVVLSSEYEGLSLSSIEGMSSGRPFLASDVDGLHEIVDGAGILIECGNEELLSKEIFRLSQDKNYSDKIVRKCILRANEYDIHKVALNYHNEYLRLCRVD